MENIASSVRIAPDAVRLLNSLSSRLGQSKARIIEQALVEFEERLFWAAVQQSYSEPEPAELREDRALWDNTASDGLSPDTF
jgi:hypothetical protein